MPINFSLNLEFIIWEQPLTNNNIILINQHKHTDNEKQTHETWKFYVETIREKKNQILLLLLM